MKPGWNWIYARRDPVAVALSALVAMLGLQLSHWTPAPSGAQAATEMTAFLDEPPKPVAPPEPARPPPPPAAHSESQQQPALDDSPPQAVAQVAAPAPPELVPPPPPATPVEVRAPEPVHVPPQASAHYEAELLAYLERIKRYPSSREARLTHPQGTVRVWFELARDGTLRAAGLMASSGSNLLDGEALRTLRGATFPPFEEQAFPGEGSHRFSAGLKYSLQSG